MFVALVGDALLPLPVETKILTKFLSKKQVDTPFIGIFISHKHPIVFLELIFVFLVGHYKLAPITLVFGWEEYTFNIGILAVNPTIACKGVETSIFCYTINRKILPIFNVFQFHFAINRTIKLHPFRALLQNFCYIHCCSFLVDSASSSLIKSS